MLRRNWKKENVIGEQKVVDGYHAIVYDDGTYHLILDEEGKVIPSNICLCAARAPSECACGAWDDVIDDGNRD